MINDFEKALKEIVSSAIPHVNIYSFASVDNLANHSGEIAAPSVSLILSRQLVASNIVSSVIITQEWLVVCTTQTGANLFNLEQSRAEAGEMYRKITQRLIGFNPLPNGYGNLRLSDPNISPISFEGSERYLLPIGFEVDYCIQSDTELNEPFYK
jgi:hypothetical protein